LRNRSGEEDFDSRWLRPKSAAKLGSDGARGFVADVLKSQRIDTKNMEPSRCSAFFCGPPPMIAAGSVLLRETGIPDSQIRRDAFEHIRSPAPVINNQKCVLCDECLSVKPIANCIVETAGIEFDENGKFSRLIRLAFITICCLSRSRPAFAVMPALTPAPTMPSHQIT
jgi:hypothetical protein